MVHKEYTIKSTDTLRKLFGDECNRNHSVLMAHPVYAEFQKRFKHIHALGKQNNVPPGEVAILISYFEVQSISGEKKSGLHLDEIEYDTLRDVYAFVRDNINRRYEILDPDMHEFLIRTGYYNKSSTSVSTKELVGRVMGFLTQMMKEHKSVEDFENFGIELGKI